MRSKLIIVLSYLSTAVWAGGYQGCLERVWLFNAYEIDSLNPSDLQTIGFACNSWNFGTKRCDGDYKVCEGSNNGRCTFDELMNHMKTNRDPATWTPAHTATGANGRIDPRQTAINCYNRYQARGNVIRNFPAWQAMKADSKRIQGQHLHDYNEYIIMLGDKINETSKAKRTEANRHLFDDADATRSQIDVARAGDHGPHLIQAAQNRMSGTIKTQDLGPDPITGNRWRTVDWAATIRDAKAAGNNDIASRIGNFMNDFYRGTASADREARRHYQVFRSYKFVKDKSISCRR